MCRALVLYCLIGRHVYSSHVFKYCLTDGLMYRDHVLMYCLTGGHVYRDHVLMYSHVGTCMCYVAERFNTDPDTTFICYSDADPKFT